jgi:transcriptional regulator with XRE-family HTH domain
LRHAYVEDDKFTEDMPFGEFVRKKRRIMGYTQADFAKRLGVDRGTVSMWELGVTSPPIDTAKDIALMLGGEILIKNHMVGTPDCPLGYCPWQE